MNLFVAPRPLTHEIGGYYQEDQLWFCIHPCDDMNPSLLKRDKCLNNWIALCRHELFDHLLLFSALTAETKVTFPILSIYYSHSRNTYRLFADLRNFGNTSTQSQFFLLLGPRWSKIWNQTNIISKVHCLSSCWYLSVVNVMSYLIHYPSRDKSFILPFWSSRNKKPIPFLP